MPLALVGLAALSAALVVRLVMPFAYELNDLSFRLKLAIVARELVIVPFQVLQLLGLWVDPKSVPAIWVTVETRVQHVAVCMAIAPIFVLG